MPGAQMMHVAPLPAGACLYPAGQCCKLGMLVGEPLGCAECVTTKAGVETWGVAVDATALASKAEFSLAAAAVSAVWNDVPVTAVVSALLTEAKAAAASLLPTSCVDVVTE